MAFRWLIHLMLLAAAHAQLFASVLTGSTACGYRIPLALGTQTFNLVLDTSTANTLVASTSCTGCSGIAPSWAGTPTSQIVSGLFVGIAWTGFVTNAEGAIGGNAAGNQKFAGLTTAGSHFFFCGNQYQGVLGLAYDGLAAGGVPTFLDSLVALGMPNGWTLQLCAGGQVVGNVWFGGADSSHAAEAFQFTPIVQLGASLTNYLVIVNSLTVNGQSLQLTNVNVPWNIVTAFAGLVFALQSDYTAVVAAMQAAQFAVCSSCSTAQLDSFYAGTYCVPTGSLSTNLVQFQLNMPGAQVIVNPANFMIINTQANCWTFTAISYGPVATNIIGSTVLQGQTVFFDRGGQRIGWAAGAQCNSAAEAAGIDVFASQATRPGPFLLYVVLVVCILELFL